MRKMGWRILAVALVVGITGLLAGARFAAVPWARLCWGILGGVGLLAAVAWVIVGFLAAWDFLFRGRRL